MLNKAAVPRPSRRAEWIQKRTHYMLLAMLLPGALTAQEIQSRRAVDDPISRVAIPSGLSRDEIAYASSALKARLHLLAQQQLTSQGTQHADLIVFVDQQRVPILPDLQAANSRVNSVANELTFTYDSPAYPWSA